MITKLIVVFIEQPADVKQKRSLFNQLDERAAKCQTAGYLETSKHMIAQFLIFDNRFPFRDRACGIQETHFC